MRLTPIPTPQQLRELLGQVEQAVHARTGGRIRGLQVRVDEGCVVVSGSTSTYYNKQLATHAIRDTVEDLAVQNEVEVC
ncbi:hypothetical protein [Schlesneria sp. T3-172]|uniref:hypothetical protein n=1 Tax=Schlesneria sphaerica TaxID=3373610 RepID=UPI0037C917B8